MMRHDTRGPRESQRQTLSGLAWETLRAGVGEAAALDRLSVVKDAQPWLDLADEARRLRLGGLLYGGCRQAAAAGAGVPPLVLQALRRQAAAAAARHARLTRAAAEVLADASGCGIRVIVLKGLALTAVLYPEDLARPMDDVDLLVSPSDRPRLTEALSRRGYRNDLRGEEDFFPPDRSYSIDLHVSLMNDTRLSARHALFTEGFDALWDRGQPILLGGVPARALGPADTLVHLALHAVHHHGLAGGRWLADLLLSLRRWPEAAEAAAAGSEAVRRSLWYCLETLSMRGDDPVPAIRHRLRPNRLLPGEARLLAAAGRGELAETFRYAFTMACLPGTAAVRFLYQLGFHRSSIHTQGFADAGSGKPSGRFRFLRSFVGQAARALVRAPGGPVEAKTPLGNCLEEQPMR